jgi:hypothetical protein
MFISTPPKHKLSAQGTTTMMMTTKNEWKIFIVLLYQNNISRGIVMYGAVVYSALREMWVAYSPGGCFMALCVHQSKSYAVIWKVKPGNCLPRVYWR